MKFPSKPLSFAVLGVSVAALAYGLGYKNAEAPNAQLSPPQPGDDSQSSSNLKSARQPAGAKPERQAAPQFSATRNSNPDPSLTQLNSGAPVDSALDIEDFVVPEPVQWKQHTPTARSIEVDHLPIDAIVSKSLQMRSRNLAVPKSAPLQPAPPLASAPPSNYPIQPYPKPTPQPISPQSTSPQPISPQPISPQSSIPQSVPRIPQSVPRPKPDPAIAPPVSPQSAVPASTEPSPQKVLSTPSTEQSSTQSSPITTPRDRITSVIRGALHSTPRDRITSTGKDAAHTEKATISPTVRSSPVIKESPALNSAISIPEMLEIESALLNYSASSRVQIDFLE
jgi:hypothetical protein